MFSGWRSDTARACHQMLVSWPSSSGWQDVSAEGRPDKIAEIRAFTVCATGSLTQHSLFFYATMCVRASVSAHVCAYVRTCRLFLLSRAVGRPVCR